ncbi:MAG: hypothetical protein GTO22_22745 [Gemmatimonadales bacterium]|nr:hypothetical protein [Gemmatimonadales bacterium]
MRASPLTVLSLATAGVFIAAVPAAAQENQLCLMCHGDVAMFSGMEDPTQLVVTEEEYTASVHGALGMRCVLCHQGYVGFPHAEDLPPPNCGGCHGAVERVYRESLHGYALQRGVQTAPTCASCHGSHDVRRADDPEARTQHENVPAMCAACHGAAGLRTEEAVRLPQTFGAYAQSVHGRNGAGEAARCTDCHGVHDLRGPLDPASKINHVNVAATCGQCHVEVHRLYDASIHGRALRAGLADSPTCTDCHGEHLILSHEDPEARTYDARLATETCGECHGDSEIIAKYGMQGGVIGTYEDSYHGWASRRDYERAATCVSCHTTHAVLPASDSASTIHPANLTATCRQCHPEADTEFATSYTHITASMAANPINYWIRAFYYVLIALTIGLMALHNAVVMNYYLIERRREERRVGYVTRLDRIQVTQHMLNAVAFIVLVVTGFALRFPDAWWVRWLTAIGMSEPVRSNVHRIAAVLLIAVAVSHVLYVLMTRRGKRELRAMLPEWRDVKDAVGYLRYYTWQSREHPRFGRYDYTQKAEYWALVWGTVIMAVTGFVLWFPVEAVRILPWWIVPASQTIHYYEAWLATLAILVWHLFFVIVHPDAYPMNWAWLTGRLPEEFVKHHHARWYEEELADSDSQESAETDSAAAAPGSRARQAEGTVRTDR